MFDLVLRLLLCVSLVLGGAGSAVASVRVVLAADAAGAASVQVAESGDEAACHGPTHAPAEAGATGDGGIVAQPAGPAAAGHGDCCSPDACTDACTQTAQVAGRHGFDGAFAASAARVAEALQAHVPPDPQRLIRPPIV